MNTQLDLQPRPLTAFTLIELLVVIAIIGVLAGLMLPVGGRIKQTAQRNKARAELEQIAFAIETYKEKLGHYPPDAPNSPRVNQLYYELIGTKIISIKDNEIIYETLDSKGQISTGEVTGKFGVDGFVNCTQIASSDDTPPAKSFLTQLKPTQYGEIGNQVFVLVCSIRWPDNHAFQPVPAQAGLNPWRYVVTNPTNNPGAFDLWVDILVGGKTNRISNWSPQPQIVNHVY